jgi:hypothetical protein
MKSSQVLLHNDHKCIKVLGPNGSKVELNSWRKQPFGGTCKEHEKTLNNLNHKQTHIHGSKRTSQQTLAKNVVPNFKDSLRYSSAIKVTMNIKPTWISTSIDA